MQQESMLKTLICSSLVSQALGLREDVEIEVQRLGSFLATLRNKFTETGA